MLQERTHSFWKAETIIFVIKVAWLTYTFEQNTLICIALINVTKVMSDSLVQLSTLWKKNSASNQESVVFAYTPLMRISHNSPYFPSPTLQKKKIA